MNIDHYYQAFKKLGLDASIAHKYARLVATSKNKENAFDTILAIVGPRRKNPVFQFIGNRTKSQPAQRLDQRPNRR